ncbi:MAG: flagellar hook basal-body protein [Alphaproteobacteria bacterium]|nr:flagellar hook basal-body protein [Alphaproteobacteria bacterium SS10]
MENTIYIALSNQVATQRRMNILANNLANLNTPGFKADRPLFLEFVEKLDGQEFRDINQRRMSLVSDYGTFTDFEQGTMNQTGGPLDMAVKGPGFFAVDIGGGALAYTRNGSFQLDLDGRIVTGAGNPVMDVNNNELVVPDGDVEVVVANDGTISTENGVIGQVKIAQFENEQFMDPLGNGLRTTDQPELENDGSEVLQGMIEGSNVNAITGITSLIEVSQAYSRSNRMGQQEHERIGRAIRKLSGTQ